jgi:hypothetical protein
MRQMEQWRLISVGEKSGKITQKQAKDLRADLKSIHKKAANYLRASSNHQLTSDQESQLKALLDKNSQVLGETPTTN